jgi:hypothetical protein
MRDKLQISKQQASPKVIEVLLLSRKNAAAGATNSRQLAAKGKER